MIYSLLRDRIDIEQKSGTFRALLRLLGISPYTIYHLIDLLEVPCFVWGGLLIGCVVPDSGE